MLRYFPDTERIQAEHREQYEIIDHTVHEITRTDILYAKHPGHVGVCQERENIVRQYQKDTIEQVFLQAWHILFFSLYGDVCPKQQSHTLISGMTALYWTIHRS